MELLHNHTTSTILKGFYQVANAVPFGLEKSFYCNALAVEMQQSELKVSSNFYQPIYYKEIEIGQLSFDTLVNDVVLIKVITQRQTIEAPLIEQMKNYLTLIKLEVLLILNFGIEADYKRVFLGNDYKKL